MNVMQQIDTDAALLNRAMTIIKTLWQQREETVGGYQVHLDDWTCIQMRNLLAAYAGDVVPQDEQKSAELHGILDGSEDTFFHALRAELAEAHGEDMWESLTAERSAGGEVVAALTGEQGEEFTIWLESQSWRIRLPDGHLIAAPLGWLCRTLDTALDLWRSTPS